MGLETATYISELNASNPVGADRRPFGDDHLRLIKAVLKAQFPNLGAAAMNATAAELNFIVGLTSDVQTQIDSKADSVDLADYAQFDTAQVFTKNQRIAVIAIGAVIGTLNVATFPTWDLENGGVFDLTITGNTTIYNPSSVQDGVPVTVRLNQSGGPHTLTWGDTFLLSGGDRPDFTQVANAVDILSGAYFGGVFHGAFLRDVK